MTASLLPGSATDWERAVEAGMTMPAAIENAISAMHGAKLINPPPSFLPFLVFEYGLGELTPFVPNLYQVIDEGVHWQRIRGTPAAIAMGLGWIGYSATLEEAWTGRTWWNAFQIRLPDVPANDDPDLDRIAGIVGLSVPERSQLRRGVAGYDIGPLTADWSRLDASLLDYESGVRIAENGPVWSFGRTHEFAHTLTEAEGTGLGNWIADAGDPLTWADAAFSWSDANFAWDADPATQRAIGMAAWFADRVTYLVLRDADGQVIGYRRARACRPVTVASAGVYGFDGIAYDPSESATSVLIEALTGFGDGAGQEAAEAGFVFGGDLVAGVQPGKLWLEPDEYSGGTEIATTALAVDLRGTVREHFKLLLGF